MAKVRIMKTYKGKPLRITIEGDPDTVSEFSGNMASHYNWIEIDGDPALQDNPIMAERWTSYMKRKFESDPVRVEREALIVR